MRYKDDGWNAGFNLEFLVLYRMEDSIMSTEV